MKIFNWTITLLTAGMLSLTACTQTASNEQSEPSTIETVAEETTENTLADSAMMETDSMYMQQDSTSMESDSSAAPAETAEETGQN